MYPEKITRSKAPIPVRDLSMHNYNQRQLTEVSAQRVMEAAVKSKPAGNFCFNGSEWLTNEYPGFAVVSMLKDNPGNEELTELLIEVQGELEYNLRPLNGFYMLPPDSFHQTVANTLSADRFKEHILNAGLETQFPDMVGHVFKNVYTSKQVAPVSMRLIGLSIFDTAIGVLGVFDKPADYGRILDFRSSFYEDRKLNSLDVKMTRPFVGHITLAYIEQKLNKNQREHMANTVNEINAQAFAMKHHFQISNTSLRRYDHLAEFKNSPDFPVYQFAL